MGAAAIGVGEHKVIATAGLGQSMAVHRNLGYEVLVPQVRDGTVVYNTLEKVEDLPAGWDDEQAPARYRLIWGGTFTVFGYVFGPRSWKKSPHPSEIRLMCVENDGARFREECERDPSLGYTTIRRFATTTRASPTRPTS